jgi:hypothetical protein
MARWRFLTVGLLALALTGNSTRTGRSAGQSGGISYSWSSPPAANADERTCVIYSLTEMGYDADLGKWIAQTIPEVIEPGSWKESGVLRYYAPKNILIVNNSTKVQHKVDAFLKNMKTSLPKGQETHAAARTTSSQATMVPVAHREPALLRTSSSVPEPSSYPVPAPVKAPKHLFHFLIRYEGEGIIDDNVVKFMKVQNIVGNKDKSDKEASEPTAQGRCAPDPLLIGKQPSCWKSSPTSGTKEKADKETR